MRRGSRRDGISMIFQLRWLDKSRGDAMNGGMTEHRCIVSCIGRVGLEV
jgi:hypothetical protein